MNVKINNKDYTVPELTFAHAKTFEQAGIPLAGMMSDHYLMTAISAFISVVVGCDSRTADHLAEQHVLSGGNLQDIYIAYVQALTESGFFKKLLGIEETPQNAQNKVTQMKK